MKQPRKKKWMKPKLLVLRKDNSMSVLSACKNIAGGSNLGPVVASCWYSGYSGFACGEAARRCDANASVWVDRTYSDRRGPCLEDAYCMCKSYDAS